MTSFHLFSAIRGILRGFAAGQRHNPLDLAALLRRGATAHGKGVWRVRARVFVAHSTGALGHDQENPARLLRSGEENDSCVC